MKNTQTRARLIKLIIPWYKRPLVWLGFNIKSKNSRFKLEDIEQPSVPFPKDFKFKYNKELPNKNIIIK